MSANPLADTGPEREAPAMTLESDETLQVKRSMFVDMSQRVLDSYQSIQEARKEMKTIQASMADAGVRMERIDENVHELLTHMKQLSDMSERLQVIEEKLGVRQHLNAE